jgi:hypothetical protein
MSDVHRVVLGRVVYAAHLVVHWLDRSLQTPPKHSPNHIVCCVEGAEGVGIMWSIC